jgi:diguanylate cyclase (GGDEF)-like protein
VANRRVLLASSAIQLDGVELGGLGVNLNEEGSQFKSVHLRDPMGIPEFAEMVREVFGSDEFFAFPVEALGEVQGVVTFLCTEPGGALSQMLGDWLILLNKALGAIESERRFHVTAVKDPVTELLNRANFLGKIEQEISRARRTTLPVSILLLAVDPYGQIVSQQGPEEANTILRVIARIIEKHSRVNDVMGRTGADEFGILLPHTARQGAMVKAERLRKLLASADFSKVLRAFPRVTVSVGVCEYPSLVRDAEELLQAADEALFSIRKPGNKTCVAKAPENFTPDFPVQEKDAP